MVNVNSSMTPRSYTVTYTTTYYDISSFSLSRMNCVEHRVTSRLFRRERGIISRLFCGTHYFFPRPYCASVVSSFSIHWEMLTSLAVISSRVPATSRTLHEHNFVGGWWCVGNSRKTVGRHVTLVATAREHHALLCLALHYSTAHAR